MDLFCCLSAGPKDDSGSNSYSKVFLSKESNELPKLNLLEDEGEGYQRDLWQLAISEKAQQLDKIAGSRSPSVQGEDVAAIQTVFKANTSASPDDFLQALTALHNKSGLAQRMPRIREIFADIQPFISAVNTLVQADMASALVWGSLCLVFASVLRFAKFWEDLRDVFQDIAHALPRFHGYVEILHTPRLHAALRNIYASFLDLCLMTLDCLQTNSCCKTARGHHRSLGVFLELLINCKDALLRFQWSSFMVTFRKNSRDLESANTEFEKEVQLAQVQEESKRHAQILNMFQGALPKAGLQTNIDIPRNEKFTGRGSTLALIHSLLTSGAREDNDAISPDSCLIHGIGGMGKTETALEYTYRFRRHYSHIFWLRSQTKVLLEQYFLEVVEKLKIVVDTRSQPRKMIELGLDWFRSTASPWLIVFDNVEDAATIRDFWPSGSTHGAILITSQNPAMAHITKHNVFLEPMLPEEGALLVQSYLGRGGSEKEAAENLAKSLGGMPLAIVHFTGYIVRSQCPVEQISQSLSNRLRASTISNIGSNISMETRAYQFTLDTVWDLSFHRLTEDAMLLLEYIAFLDPDHIPVDLFIGGSEDSCDFSTAAWQYWDILRFNDAVGVLCERHLVDRSVSHGNDSLRTHRALQIRVLGRLREDLTRRAARLNTVVAIIRKAVPRANIVKRSDASQFERFAKSLPQIISVRSVFVVAEPTIQSTVSFATLLHDFTFYAFSIHNNSVALAMAETGKAICEGFENDPDARALLPELVNMISQIIHYHGIEGRQRALAMMRRVVKMREEELRDIPEEQWTESQSVTFARGQADLAWELCELDLLDEAAPLIDKAADIYRRIKNDIRLAQVCINRLMILSTRQEKEKTLEEGRKALDTVQKAFGKENFLTILMTFQAALAYFTVGEVVSALDMMESVLQKWRLSLGNFHDLTLAAQYCIAVFSQNLGLLEHAESNLREIVKDNYQTEDWREEDNVRAKFRLSIVLRAQGRNYESDMIRLDVGSYISKRRSPQKAREGYTDADDMELLDYGVTLCHGRTAGIWGKKDRW